MVTKEQEQLFLSTAAPAAVEACKGTQCPPAMVLAQAILESDWGQSMTGNNCFGIKPYPGCYGTQLKYSYERFTGEQVLVFLKGHPERSAEVRSAPDAEGRILYRTRDEFATFPDLIYCFDKRVELFNAPVYAASTDQYKEDGDLKALIYSMASTYATGDGYGDEVWALVTQGNVMAALAQAQQT